MLHQIPHTPAIVVDEPQLDANISAMADFAAEHQLELRPHAKTHKIATIGHKQLAAGSQGLSVATVGEAQYFFDAGITDLFIAYPLWVTSHDAAVLTRIADDGVLAVGTDSVAAVHQLADATGSHPGIEIMIEVNSGHNRSGVLADQVLPIAEACRDRNLVVRGLFTFPGHSYAPDQQMTAAEQEAQTLQTAARYLADAGFHMTILSGGSTPSATLTAAGGPTEIRPGVYVFGDAQQLELDRIGFDQLALTVVTTVVSRHEAHQDAPARIIVDAGSKILSSDKADWATGYGRVLGHPQARVTALSEHHGTVIWDSDQLPAIGSRIQVVPNHVCVAVNLVDEVYVVGNGQLIDSWKVGARGVR